MQILIETMADRSEGVANNLTDKEFIDMLKLDKKASYQTIRLFDEIADETDMLVADVPAGASDSSLAFVSAADKVLIVLVGEPTSFLDAYSLIKAAHLDAGLSNFSVVVNMTQSEAQAKAHFAHLVNLWAQAL